MRTKTRGVAKTKKEGKRKRKGEYIYEVEQKLRRCPDATPPSLIDFVNGAEPLNRNNSEGPTRQK